MAQGEAKRYSIVMKLPESNSFEYLTIPNPESHVSLYDLDLYTGEFPNESELKKALGIPDQYELYLTYKNFGKDWFIPLAYRNDSLLLEIAQEKNDGNEEIQKTDKLVYLFSLVCSRNYFMRQENWAKEKTLANSFFTDCNLSPETTEAIINYFNGEIDHKKLINNFKTSIKSYRKVRNIYFAIKQMIAKLTLKELDEKIVSREMFLLMQELKIDTGIITEELVASIIDSDKKTFNDIQAMEVGANLKDKLATLGGLKPDGVPELVYNGERWVNGNKFVQNDTSNIPKVERPNLLIGGNTPLLIEEPNYDSHGTPEEKELEAEAWKKDQENTELVGTHNELGIIPDEAKAQGYTDIDWDKWAELTQQQKDEVLSGGIITPVTGPVLTKTLDYAKGADEVDGQLPLSVPELIEERRIGL